MKALLPILDKNIQQLRPSYYANLNAGLSDQEIETLEQKYTLKLPEDLRTLYQWKNGQKDKCYEAFVNNSMFHPLDRVLASRAMLSEMEFDEENWWNAKWIPVFHNGAGDHICYDMGGTFTGSKGQLIEFWHADSDRNVIAPDLTTFLSVMNDYYRNTDPEEYDDFFIIDIEGFPKQFRTQ